MDQYPRRHPETAYRAVGEEGGMVVLSNRSEIKVLNPVGIKIFSLLDGQHSTEEIIRQVTEEFDVGEEQAGRELAAFLEELASEGMLAEPEPAAAEGDDR